MTLADDTRGRVPFAFLGALLLLSSTLYAATAAPSPVVEPVTEEVIDEAQTNARIAVTTAIRDAGREAAREPVLDRGDTRFARLLSAKDTFRSYLRLRIALEARRTLDSSRASSGSLAANVSLPPIEDVADAESAMANVTIRPVSGHRYQVNVTGLQVTLRRDGRPVDRFAYNTSVTVRIPALRLHARTERFESRLQGGIDEPGFNRDLTTRIFAITWARGYAQYGGAPIANVLANRHVEVMANHALLAQQAAVFGAEDPAGRRSTRRAVTNVALRDAFRGAEEGLKSAAAKRQKQTDSSSGTSAPSVPMPSVFDSESSYHVDNTADQAFLRFVEGDEHPDLGSAVDAVYQAAVRADADARFVGSETSHEGRPLPNATLLATQQDSHRRLAEGSWSHATGSTLRRFEGTVVETDVTTRIFANNFTLTVTRTVHRSEYDVSIDLDCRYESPGRAPDRSIDRCPFGSTARLRLTSESMDHVIRDAGGARALALDAVDGDGGTDWETVDIEPPGAAIDAAYDGTADLRRSARDVSVSLETRSIASSANPASILADRLEGDRSSLLDTPSRYGSAEDRAVAAARTVYLDQLVDDLRSRSPVVDRAQQELASTLSEHAIPSAPPEGKRHSLSRLASGIDADPAYLSIAARGSEPDMAARNVNIFSVPYGDAADVITEKLGGSGRSVSLRTAAQTLAVSRGQDGRSRAEHRLRRSVSNSLDRSKARYRSELEGTVSSRTARSAVRAAFAEWDTVSDRALAITNGEMAAAIAAEVDSDTTAREQDRLTVELRVVSTSIREDDSVNVPESLVEKATRSSNTASRTALKAGLKDSGTKAAKAAWKRGTDQKAASLPAGLPLLPVPGSWYATVNAWTVSVKGSYDEFTVEAARAAPGKAPNGTIEYVRADRDVTLDVDGDGLDETLGRNRPVTFAADTGVVVVVPPGKSGVGDVDGNADERSPGWGT